MTSVVVLTGAGASHDCRSDQIGGAATKPPLVKDLFRPDYRLTLDRYPLVRQAAVDIRRAMLSTGESAVSLEQFLRERMRASQSPYTQRRYRQVPLYLQDVLTQASSFTSEPDNYNALVNAALEFDQVLFLTLNYDTLLDSRLAEYTHTDGMEWYVRADPRWALVKLHGSVNWGWPLTLEQGTQYAATVEWANKLIDDYGELATLDPDEICLRGGNDVAHRRLGGQEEATVYYPAIAVPLGEADELVCPSSHINAAAEHLKSADGLHIVVIGYSGVDQEVLRLFSDSGNSIRRMLVANNSVEAATDAASRIAGAFRTEVKDEWITSVGFTELVAQGILARWFDET